MSKEIKSLENLSDSNLFMEKDVPAIGRIILILISVFCLAMFWLSLRIPKVYIIEARGTVSNISSNFVMSPYTGIIDECNVKEGKLVDEGELIFEVNNIEKDLQKEQLFKEKNMLIKNIEKYQLLVSSIKDDVNYFDASSKEDELYYSAYEAYKSQIVQNTLDVSSFKNFGYSDEQIESELRRNQGKLSEIYFSAIQTAEYEILEAESQLETINSQLATIENAKAAYEVRANASGIIHLVEDYKNGMVVQTGTTVATITPENDKRIIEAYVTAADMARMKEGDSVQIEIEGLARNVYGTISGNVQQIASNVTIQQGADGTIRSMFRVIISMENDYLISKDGDKVNISNGMAAVARIQYDKVKYFDYILDKIGFKI